MIYVTRYVSASMRFAVLGVALSACGGDGSNRKLAPAGAQAQCPACCTLQDASCPSGSECWTNLNMQEFLCCNDRPLASFVPVFARRRERALSDTVWLRGCLLPARSRLLGQPTNIAICLL